MLPDLNAEFLDYNRHPNESLPQYLKRVWEDELISDTNCCGMEEMIFPKFKEYNKLFKTSDSTYYFAHATGERKREREKCREIFKEPSKLANLSFGFTSDVKERIKYRNTLDDLRRRNNKDPISWYERISIFFKVMMNGLSLE
mmetsp:Transcript_1285/g.1562  ORF Transcript_1285/g.1562 Transcript_1285/m.1562 type:complete len:143 (+) Transcript_1285:1153-1581(+)